MVARQLGRDRPLSPWSCETVEKLGGHVHILNKPEQLRGPLSPHRKDGTQNEEAGPYRQSVSARLSSSVLRRLGALDIQDSCFSLTSTATHVRRGRSLPWYGGGYLIGIFSLARLLYLLIW